MSAYLRLHVSERGERRGVISVKVLAPPDLLTEAQSEGGLWVHVDRCELAPA